VIEQCLRADPFDAIVTNLTSHALQTQPPGFGVLSDNFFLLCLQLT
jgi:hypothetical protein